MIIYYDKIIEITSDYLGPAANRFVNRQISSHLHKSPEELGRSDVHKLAIRIRSGLVVLTRDEQAVNEAYQRIMALGDSDIHKTKWIESN